jgi:hypothetical protein
LLKRHFSGNGVNQDLADQLAKMPVITERIAADAPTDKLKGLL